MVAAKTLNPFICQPASLEAGIDEAGRGCLAGPVAAAAVILPQEYSLSGLADSKLLSPKKRYFLEMAIKQQAVAWTVALIWQQRIDETNILYASHEAMAHAASTLKEIPSLLLIDGNQPIPDEILKGQWQKRHNASPPHQHCVVGGDRIIHSISAASILAKTFRDRLMIMLADKFPGYGFEKHKGYGTKEHIKALETLGPSPLHRLSFRKVLSTPYSQFRLMGDNICIT